MIEVQELTKYFGATLAVNHVSFKVEKGEIIGLLGPNGSGKTTIMRILTGFFPATSGRAMIGGLDVAEHSLETRRRVGYLPEERGLYRKMTVVDQLLFLAEIHGMKRGQALPAIQAWLERVELGDWGRRKVEELSKGMQQKVQLIGTLLHQPQILILDEPFSGLDPINQGLFKELLLEYRQEGRTILFSTHGMEQAEKLCDHIALISHGRLVLSGDLKEIKRRLGGNSYRLVAVGDLARLESLPAIEQVVRRGDDGAVKLLLRPEASGAEVLRQIVPFLDVREFRSEEPDLEEIFIKAVRDAA